LVKLVGNEMKRDKEKNPRMLMVALQREAGEQGLTSK
jgi:hypothetical protein